MNDPATRTPWPSWSSIRDPLICVSALILIIYEAVRGGEVRPELLFLYGGMLGLPAFMNRDEKAGKDR